MHVEHLLRDETLGLRLLWSEHLLLGRQNSGVTVTDLEDPTRFVRPGEVVLSGLVWWTPEGGRDKADRFVAGLRDADAAVLLAGEETHGAVPDDLIEACARFGIPLAAVPADVMFRAVTDTVYLQQWGELSHHHALPQNARARLSSLVAQDAGPDAIVAAAFAHLDREVVAYVLTPTGRTVAATGGGVEPSSPATDHGRVRRKPCTCMSTPSTTASSASNTSPAATRPDSPTGSTCGPPCSAPRTRAAEPPQARGTHPRRLHVHARGDRETESPDRLPGRPGPDVPRCRTQQHVLRGSAVEGHPVLGPGGTEH